MDYSKYVKNIGDLLKYQLNFVEKDQNIYINKVCIKDQNFVTLECFIIEINLTPVMKGELPEVRELEGKIPNNVRYHKITKTNTFCFGIGLYNRYLFNYMIEDFHWFYDKQILGYLYSCISMKIFGVWGSDEFSHDFKKAQKEDLFHVLGFDETNHSFRKLTACIKNQNKQCFCNSKKKYKDCHKLISEKYLKKLSKTEILEVLNQINKEKQNRILGIKKGDKLNEKR